MLAESWSGRRLELRMIGVPRGRRFPEWQQVAEDTFPWLPLTNFNYTIRKTSSTWRILCSREWFKSGAAMAARPTGLKPSTS
jgi:hypothetical protein